MILAEHVVQVASTKVPVIHLRCDRDGALQFWWNAELVPNQYRSAGLDRVVIGDRVDGPDLVIVDEPAIDIHRAIGEAVRSLVQHSVRLDETAVIDLLARRVLGSELNPCLVKIAHLGNQRVPDILVLNHHQGLHYFIRLEAERH